MAGKTKGVSYHVRTRSLRSAHLIMCSTEVLLTTVRLVRGTGMKYGIKFIIYVVMYLQSHTVCMPLLIHIEFFG